VPLAISAYGGVRRAGAGGGVGDSLVGLIASICVVSGVTPESVPHDLAKMHLNLYHSHVQQDFPEGRGGVQSAGPDLAVGRGYRVESARRRLGKSLACGRKEPAR
jgi:hypothetical protein